LRILEYPKLIDNPSYRYQRNGLPLMAWLASRIIGQQYTSPFVYFLVAFGITSFAFGLLVSFLKEHSVHPAWALIWGLYGGVIRPMIHGLPDSTADSFLLICILSVINHQIGCYMVAASLLCLCRESYAAPAFVVWLLTVLNRFDWGRERGYLIRITSTAIPGAVVLGWAFYVAYATKSSLLSGSRSIPWGGLVDWPFFAYVRCNVRTVLTGSLENNFLYSTSCALVLAVVLTIIIRGIKANEIAIAILVHVLLMTMTGWIVWEAGVGYFKNTASVVMIGVMLLPFSNSKWLRFALLLSFAFSLHYLYRNDFRKAVFLPPLENVRLADGNDPNAPEQELSRFQSPDSIVSMEKPCEHRSTLEIVRASEGENTYRGLFFPFHRFPKKVMVKVTNDSVQVWPKSLPGDGAVTLAWQIRNPKGRIVQEGRIAMYKNVEPGDSIELPFRIPSGSWVASKQTVRVGLIQDGDAWFDRDDPSQSLVFEN